VRSTRVIYLNHRDCEADPSAIGFDELREIAQRCARLPTLDDRSVEEILGYDERGLPR
jgi:hypothetical protein